MSDLLRSVAPFQDTLAEVVKWAADRDLILTRAHFSNREGMPVARWPDGTWQDFLRAAQQTGTKMIWVEVRNYVAVEEETNAQSEGALSVIEYPTNGEAKDNAANDETHRSLVSLDLSWSYQGVLNVFLAKMCWNESAWSSTSTEVNLEQNLEKVIEHAKLLIDLPRYTAKKSKAERRRLARRMFGSKADINPILKQAEALTEASQKK